MNVTDLRKAFSAQGIKGFGSANRATFTAAIEAAEVEAYAEDAARTPAPVAAAPAAKKGLCNICGKRRNYTGPGDKAPRASDMCNPCFEEGGWENTHSDAAHSEIDLENLTEEQALEVRGCWICYPELNLAQAEPKTGRSRAGMVIVAKGTEIHKSVTFKEAAEAAGWSVVITTTVDADENERHTAAAKKGDDLIVMKWSGRAYDYPASNAILRGKARKVRNLKEALRLL